MGVDDLPGMDTPQNKGGRPKGSTTEEEKQSREVEGDPYVRSDGDEYWEEVWRLHYSKESSLRVVILNVAQYTSCLPRTVVENIHNREVFSFEEFAEDPPEWFETHMESLKLEGINTRFAPSPDKKGGGTASSGLSSLIGDDDEDDGFLDGIEDDQDDDSTGLEQLLE